MDVKGGYPWWTVRNGLLRDYPPLSDDVECEVVVVGAGITGALIARALVDAGLDTIVLDRRDVGWGSTAASTALLQYEIDTELLQLAKLVGHENALAAYKACEGAVSELHSIADEVGDVGWRETPSLYLASSRRDARRLRPEFDARREAGFRVEWLDESALRERFGLVAPAAILSRPAAHVDPYRFTHRLLAQLCERGLRVFDRCGMVRWEPDAGALEIHTSTGARVRAQWLAMAAGYESQSLLPQNVAKNRSSYAFVSEPLQLPREFARCIGWETARPYLYWRGTDDGRLIVGGEDDRIDIPARRDWRIPSKVEKLLGRLQELMPDAKPDVGFAWAGTFAETADGLPWFGAHPKLDSRVLFAMAYGGNGITYSAIGAHILADAVRGKPHPLAALFGFERDRLDR
ncbi:MAG TPA: FAD-dependent oxidoreductase [Rhodanobacteraceae bacterium]|nr:FAD-dependent oxidoreductase [Rhodanobacteraceae bacterium]